MGKAKFDLNGQPLYTSAFNACRLSDRNIDELTGLCRGIIFDGVVTQAEAEALFAWLKMLEHGAGQFPANVLRARLEQVLMDGDLDSEEAKDLFGLLVEIVGGKGDTTGPCTMTLPFDEPQPDIHFDFRRFVVTGRFAYGPRTTVAGAIVELGGEIAGNVSQLVSYLVCGHFASRDWVHTNHGRKIQAALDLRDKGHDIAIISEQHWAECVRVGSGV